MLYFRSLAPAVLLSLSVAACGADSDEAVASAPVPAPTPVAVTTVDTTVAQIRVIERRIAANNAKDWTTWESLHVEGAVRTAPELLEPLRGAKAMRAGIEELVKTFPDYHLTLVEAFGSGDRLVARMHTRGTMLGPLDMGGGTVVPPTGKTFEQDWVAVLRFEGDRIAAIDEFHDNYGILLQLGLSGS